MKRFIIVVLTLACFFLGVSTLAQASPFLVDDGRIHGHKGPDGTISFLVQDSASNWKVQVHKVFTAEGRSYYFLFADITNSNFAKKPLPKLVLSLNNQEFALPLLEGTKPVVEKKNCIAWYALPEDAVQMLSKVNAMSFTLQFEGVPPITWKPFDSKITGFKNLVSVEKNAYIREGDVAPSNLEKIIYSPQIFIPNVKPEEVMDALIYEANITEYKGKEEFNYSDGYFIYHTTDPQVTQLICRNTYDNGSDFVTVACRPYNNGVWVTMSLLIEKSTPGYYGYAGAYFPGSTYYLYYDEKTSYWRMNADIWANRLHSVYNQLYGKVDYGITWEWKNVNKGPFKLASIDAKNFPELGAFAAGDVLTAIDGVPTALMGLNDITYCLDNGFSGAKTFTFQTKTGEVKSITVNPHIQLTAVDMRKDYKKKLADKMPKWFTKKDVITLDKRSYVLESDVYNPLGSGLK
ncbi:MAG: hypothetical protein LLG02_12210 [Pelosinus sp.]|nr:hypothetical protein [Pelosinus sp.]